MNYRQQEGLKKPWMVLVAILFSAPIYATSSSPVYETSFNCEKASSKVEKMICATGDLARLDVRLARIYQIVLASSANGSAIKARQRQWLGAERNACSDVACIKTAYEKRISELRPPLVISGESGWHNYVNREFGISIYYPDEMTVLTGKRAEYYYFVSLVKPDIRIAFPPKALWGGNLSQASVSIEGDADGCSSYNDNLPDRQTPLYDAEGMALMRPKITVINGVTFHEFDVNNAATGGNSIEGTYFETIRNGKCFTIGSMVETGSSEEPITEQEDVEKIKKTLMRIMRSLKFLTN